MQIYTRLWCCILCIVGLCCGQISQAEIITATAIKDGKPYQPHYVHLIYANPDAPKGGTFSQARIGSFDSVNPFIDKGVAAAGSFYLYDTLLTGSLDEVGVSYVQLASAVTYDTKDPSWVIYHINPKARFWDGSAVLADDVKATFEAILTKGLVSWRSYLADIKHVEVIDNHQVKFYFHTKDNINARWLVGQMPIFAKVSIERSFEQAGFTPLMGSGAYQVERISQGRRISYKKDPNYWGVNVMANQGRFNFERLVFVYYGSDEMAFLGFGAGDYGYHTETNAKRWASYRFVRLRDGKIHRQSLRHSNPLPMQMLVMNLRRPLFAQRNLRLAMNLAFDFNWLNHALLYGQYERLTSYFQGSMLQAVGLPSDDEYQLLKLLPLNDNEKTALMGLPKVQADHSDYHRTGLLQARKLLLAAGFSYHQGKLYDPDGRAVAFEILLDDEQKQKQLTPYVAQLKRLGMDVRLYKVDGSEYVNRVRRFDYDVIVDTFYQGVSPGIEQSYLWGSDSAVIEGSQNTIGIQSAAVDDVIYRLSQSDNQEQIVLYSKVLDRLLQAGVYGVPLYANAYTNIAYDVHYHHTAYEPRYAIALDYWWYQN